MDNLNLLQTFPVRKCYNFFQTTGSHISWTLDASLNFGEGNLCTGPFNTMLDDIVQS